MPKVNAPKSGTRNPADSSRLMSYTSCSCNHVAMCPWLCILFWTLRLQILSHAAIEIASKELQVPVAVGVEVAHQLVPSIVDRGLLRREIGDGNLAEIAARPQVLPLAHRKRVRSRRRNDNSNGFTTEGRRHPSVAWDQTEEISLSRSGKIPAPHGAFYRMLVPARGADSV